jgi:hypothetical protein
MTVAPYGTWPSPITPAAAAAHSGASSWRELYDIAMNLSVPHDQGDR